MPNDNPSQLLVTVVIPTYNRGPKLRETIKSLWRQTVPASKFEILVVDNCSTDGTEEIVRQLQAQSPCAIRYHRNDRNRGCFFSTNWGVENASTDIVAMSETDCEVHPEWLERGLKAFDGGDQIAFVAGHMADKPGQTVKFFSMRNGATQAENPYYPSGNIFYRRSVYLKMGGCREDLSFGDVGTRPVGCGDSDLAWRIKEAGYKYVYSPEVIAYHDVVTVTPFEWLRAHTRLIVIPELIRRHPALRSTLRWNVFFFADNALFYVALLSLMFALVSPWFLAGTIPYVVRMATVPGRPLAWLNLPKTIARVGLLSLRQAVICGSLAYGSLRSRSLVL